VWTALSSPKVYLVERAEDVPEALRQLPIEALAGKKVLVKLHMGEAGNLHYLRPREVKPVVDLLKDVGAEPFLFDTVTLYPGPRATKLGYRLVARRHGFYKLGVPVVIGDGGWTVREEGVEWELAAEVRDADAFLIFSHFKGHGLTGFGGAIKNMGMGFASRRTKGLMHDGCKPVHEAERCTFCKRCAEVCPAEAITIEKGRWLWSPGCFGCGNCVEVCPAGALRYRLMSLQRALAIVSKIGLQNKPAFFVNAAIRISRYCDCAPGPNDLIAPDIGFLVSTDPVAVDAAALDLVVERVGYDVFQQIHRVDSRRQIREAEAVGLGRSAYEIVRLT